MRVWERGVGITMASGSSACATAVAAIRRGYTDREVLIKMDRGELQIEWRESDNHVYMTGPLPMYLRDVALKPFFAASMGHRSRMIVVAWLALFCDRIFCDRIFDGKFLLPDQRRSCFKSKVAVSNFSAGHIVIGEPVLIGFHINRFSGSNGAEASSA